MRPIIISQPEHSSSPGTHARQVLLNQTFSMDNYHRERKAAQFPWKRFFGLIFYLLIFPAGLLFTMAASCMGPTIPEDQKPWYKMVKYEMRASLALYFLCNWCVAIIFAMHTYTCAGSDPVLQATPAVIYACTAVLRASISAAGIQLKKVEQDLKRRKGKLNGNLASIAGVTDPVSACVWRLSASVAAAAAAAASVAAAAAAAASVAAAAAAAASATVKTSELLDSRARWIIEYAIAAEPGVKLRELDGDEKRDGACAQFFKGGAITKRLHTVTSTSEMVFLAALALPIPAYIFWAGILATPCTSIQIGWSEWWAGAHILIYAAACISMR
jgi:hypothetical protein